METKIKILKDTPFNLAGDILGIEEFRLKYNYICTKDVSNLDLIISALPPTLAIYPTS